MPPTTETAAELDVLLAADPDGVDPDITARALALRHEAIVHGAPDGSRVPVGWPPTIVDPFPDIVGLPEIEPAEVALETVCGSILHHGAVIVRGLGSSEWAAELTSDIDRGFDAFDRWVADRRASDVAPWFVRFAPATDSTLRNMRSWVRQSGAMWAAECPPVAGRILARYAQLGLREILTGYFGERPALSVNKFTLRRATPDAQPIWHQDGAFLGDGVRSVNVWVTLTDCGGDAPVPGLDLVPRRVDAILDTATRGSTFKDSIGHDLVAEVAAAAGSQITRPGFAAGDALIFDERFVHRTATDPTMTANRYAIESWFFSPSRFPPAYVPLLF